VFNDAQAALLGEVWLGAARQLKNVVLLTLELEWEARRWWMDAFLHGHLGRAGHLGHVSLNPDGALDIVNTPGSLEDEIGECSLTTRSNGRFSSTRELVAQFRQGVPTPKSFGFVPCDGWRLRWLGSSMFWTRN